MSFYGSTPNYAFIWDEAGFEGTTARIREKQKAGDLKGMAAQITDEHIAVFATEATWDGLADALIAKYGCRGANRDVQRGECERGSLRTVRRGGATDCRRHRGPLALTPCAPSRSSPMSCARSPMRVCTPDRPAHRAGAYRAAAADPGLAAGAHQRPAAGRAPHRRRSHCAARVGASRPVRRLRRRHLPGTSMVAFALAAAGPHRRSGPGRGGRHGAARRGVRARTRCGQARGGGADRGPIRPGAAGRRGHVAGRSVRLGRGPHPRGDRLPHFFTPEGESQFCPVLDISRDDVGNFVIAWKQGTGRSWTACSAEGYFLPAVESLNGR